MLCLAVVSHLAEAITIAWEIIRYNAPARAMIPVTLMGVFATQVRLSVERKRRYARLHVHDSSRRRQTVCVRV